MISTREGQRLRELIRERREGYSLPRALYVDDLVYRADVERIWRRGWLFAGHSCEIRERGQFFTIDLDTDSLIVLRGDDHEVHAFHNLCRHRGTTLLDEESGALRSRSIVCPYHQWTYGLDGELLSCRGMHEEIDSSELSLHRAHVREVEGLIFISLAHDREPPDFEPAAEEIRALAGPQGLSRAKVAKRIDYEVAANWKLVWENNRECYHCNVNHPQYIRANFDHYNADDTTERIQARLDEATRRGEEKWASQGLAPTHRRTGVATFPDADRDLWYAVNRTVLVDGYVSETMDGCQVAPLMGDYDDPDVGTLRMRTMPNFWNHSSCDHSVSTRLLPAGPDRTSIRVTWLVDENASEGVDYRLDKVLPFWQLTSEQDWELCERAQRGVGSSRYTPGPYSTTKEYNVDGFVRWYLARLGEES